MLSRSEVYYAVLRLVTQHSLSGIETVQRSAEMDLRCDESLSPHEATPEPHAEEKEGVEVGQVAKEVGVAHTSLHRETRVVDSEAALKVTSPKQRKPYDISDPALSSRAALRVSLDDSATLERLIEELLKVIGFCDWPGVIWSLHLCPRCQWPELIESYSPGRRPITSELNETCSERLERVMVLFYGERTIMWVNQGRLYSIEENQENRIRNLQKWGDKNDQGPLASAALDELNYSYSDVSTELDRLQCPVPLHSPEDGAIHPEICAGCHEFNVHVNCEQCTRGWHTLCLKPPVLKKQDFRDGRTWTCQACSTVNKVVIEEEEEEETESREDSGESNGLTPDWIIHASAYEVFLLEKPTPERHFIPCLLDPCTNDKNNPNILAEKLYDKHDNGLKLSNSWSGYYVILNPDFKSQVQWRFVNRAIDEVENDRVPAVILICRNSTDTAYYQRLRPYPRVLLRRQCVKFKDYDNTPIGFGIVIFCIAKRDWEQLYTRFLDAFSPFGEINMPIDLSKPPEMQIWGYMGALETLQDEEFRALTRRVHEQAAMSYRDHWMQCNACKKWRIVPYEVFTEYKDKDWQCSDLKSNTTCLTLQRKVEVMGVTYASGVDKGLESPRGEPMEGISEEEEEAEEVTPEVHDVLMDVEQSCFSVQRDTSYTDDLEPVQKPGEDLSAFAQRIACRETLEKLAHLPPRSNVKIMQALDVTSESSMRQRDLALSSLELARQASTAANRAYLKGLGEEPSAIHKGKVKGLSAQTSLVIDAAKEIAKKATVAELDLQYQKMRRHYEALARKHQIEISRLAKQLEKKKKQERDAKQAKEIALAAKQELEESVNRLTASESSST